MLRALFEPYALLFLLTWAGMLSLWWKRAAGPRRLLVPTAGLALLTAANLPIVGWLLFATLEAGYRPGLDVPADAGALVVLGGYVRPDPVYPLGGVLADDTMGRCVHAVEVHKASGIRPVVVSGGDLDPDKDGPTVALAMAEELRARGVADEALLLEESSLNTIDNARECRRRLEPTGTRRIVLVTDAFHMRRAAACFERQGFEVIPSPCHFRSTEAIVPRFFLPSPTAARGVFTAIHEWVGLAWYRLRGYA